MAFVVTVDEATTTYDLRVIRYFYLAAFVLPAYDILLTMDLEVRYIWKVWQSRTAVWYLFLRYSSLAVRIMTLVTFYFAAFEPAVCRMHLYEIHSLRDSV
ncbi:hypothetical protein R3P38DRAFT_3219124 [Favolaschia claudopus]|uniref:DUF6533 domain-containing protein n=1 Tax=Favolaschia claudopus TaxID=2862362 RepID=A0AAW0A276_9AGAR